MEFVLLLRLVGLEGREPSLSDFVKKGEWVVEGGGGGGGEKRKKRKMIGLHLDMFGMISFELCMIIDITKL